MKKTYINPSMEVVEIKAQQLLAGSINTLGGNYGGGGIQSREIDEEYLFQCVINGIIIWFIFIGRFAQQLKVCWANYCFCFWLP